MLLNTPENTQEIPNLEFVWVELTNQCNLTCAHCYSNSGPFSGSEDRVSHQQYLKIIEDAFACGCRSIQFIGGEPTLNKNLLSYLDLSAKLGFAQIEIFSNLTHLNPILTKKIVGHNVAIATSFYSFDKITHDKITGRRGSFDAAVKNLCQLCELNVQLRVGIIEMEENAGHLDRTKSFLESIGVKEIRVDIVRSVGRGKMKDTNHGLCGHCVNGSLCVSASGSVFPCIMSRDWTVGSVSDSSLDEIARSKKLSQVRRDLASTFKNQKISDCSPHDRCEPGACHPQIGGPPECMPQRSCMPEVIPCNPKGKFLADPCQPNLCMPSARPPECAPTSVISSDKV